MKFSTHILALMVCFSVMLPAWAAAEKPLRFVFISTCRDEAFFQPVKKGMEDAAKRMGVECMFTGTEGVDVKAQAAMVRKAVAEGYDGIALNIIDPKAFDEVVREAIGKGVPVVAFNVDDHRTPNARLSAVVQRFDAAGKTLGQGALDFVTPGSQVLMTLHDEGVSALDERIQNAQKVLKEKGITWKVIATGTDPEKACEIITKTLRENPGIKTVLGTGQADTEGAGLAIERHFQGKGYTAAGFDLSPNILRLIHTGCIRFTIDQQPYVQGFYPVVQLTLYKRYGIMPADIDAGATIIDKKNVDGVIELKRKQYR